MELGEKPYGHGHESADEELPATCRIEKNFCRRPREGQKKVLYYSVPRRSSNKAVYAGLHVVSCTKRSTEGWNSYVDESLETAAQEAGRLV